MQSLLVTCRLHDVGPIICFVDVLQRVGQRPASQRSDLYDVQERQSRQ
jgi:transposase